MALKNIKNYLSVVMRNGGVLKTDQLELTGQSSAPTTNLSNGRIYYDSTNGSIVYRHGSAWVNLVTTENAWNKRFAIRSLTTTTTLTAVDNNSLIVANSTGGSMYLYLPSAATPGLHLWIVNKNPHDTGKGGNLYICAPKAASNHQWVSGASSTYKLLNSKYDAIHLIADGSTEWLRVNEIA